ncbi:DNA methyltransferase [Paraliomyxa miuraensis]|uniref:DNA methyltransferase n=1 Tax=Paraliomyxa miuraensis TaxID=376150 RepID=UPI00224C7C49|nr:site-specific DNA-methyltransferase [Paraliomyxa miuraensis]MCX4241062.1 site-specific DNA-methyltransferase [Paraliomyxa miuraensis]
MSDDGKGLPGLELRWPGKYDAQGRRVPVPRPGATLRRWAAYGASDEAEGGPDRWRNRLVEGDNLRALDALVREHRGTVDLVYVDPPFATGGRFEVITPVGETGGRLLRQPAYADAWPGGPAGLVAMLDPRLRLVHELLAPHGSLYVHVDPTVGHAIKLLLDEVFGPGCFQREIVWRIGWVSGFKTKARNWIRNHDLLFFYVKDPKRFTFNKSHLPHPPGYRRRDGSLPRGRGVPLDDVWNAGEAELSLRGRDSLDSIQIKSFSTEKTGYATQKNESVLRRIVEASSNPGDLVADLFCGSGTTMAVAEALGRRWIGCDVGRSAIHITTGRLLGSTGPRGFEVLQVGHDEPPRAIVEARVREGWQALTGRALDRLRMETQVEERGAARAGRRVAAEAVAAWRWSVPVGCVVAVDAGSRGESATLGESVAPGRRKSSRPAPVELVLPRVLLHEGSPSPAEGAIAERARVLVRLSGLPAGPLRIELLSLAYPTPALLPLALREPPPGPLELVERWAVTWNDDGSARVDEVLGRFDRERTLPTRSSAHVCSGRTATVVVRVEDALHREHRLRIRVVRGRRGWGVDQAHAEAGAEPGLAQAEPMA